MPDCESQWHLSSLTGAFLFITKEVILMPILYSYTPEEVEKFKAKLKQAEERAAFFEQAYKQEQAKNSKLQQQQKAD